MVQSPTNIMGAINEVSSTWPPTDPNNKSDIDPPIVIASRLTTDSMRTAGIMLAFIVITSVIMNVYTFYVVRKNWRRFLEHPFSQSNILCMFLSMADLQLAVFVGFPAVLHLTFAGYFSEQPDKSMINYSMYVSYFLMEYIFILRVLGIGSICVDRCVHIMWPLAYKYSVTHYKTAILCVLMMAAPLIFKTLPTLLLLVIGDKMYLKCLTFKNPNTEEAIVDYIVDFKNFTVPLTCTLQVGKYSSTLDIDQVKKFAEADATILALFILITFAVILFSNMAILVIIVRRFKNRRGGMVRNVDKQQSKTNKSILKNLIATFIMGTVFLLTDIPYVYVFVEDFLQVFYMAEGDRLLKSDILKLYLICSIFLSLLVNPWLYPLRMETIRRFFPCFNSSTTVLRSKILSTRTSLFSMFPKVKSLLNIPNAVEDIHIATIAEASNNNCNLHGPISPSPSPSPTPLYNLSSKNGTPVLGVVSPYSVYESRRIPPNGCSQSPFSPASPNGCSPASPNSCSPASPNSCSPVLINNIHSPTSEENTSTEIQ